MNAFFKILALVAVLIFCQYQSHAQKWDFQSKLSPLDLEAQDNFGISTAISDTFMLVGAWFEDGDKPGENPVSSAGAAYMFQKDGNGSWQEMQKFVSPNREVSGYFGFSVAVEGNYALVGAYNEDRNSNFNVGRVYAYRYNGLMWLLEDSLFADDGQGGDLFGYAVALEKEYALIGAHKHKFDDNGNDPMDGAGAAYLFKRTASGKWDQLQKLVAPDRGQDHEFGKYLDIDGLGIAIGAFNANEGTSVFETGAVYGAYCNDTLIFWGYDNITSADLMKIENPDPDNFEFFGWDVAVSGKWLSIGASGDRTPPPGGSGLGNGSVYFYKWENGNWVNKQQVYPSDFETSGQFGRFIGLDGTVCVIGAGTARTDASGGNPVNGAGAAHIFELQPNGQWVEVEKLSGTQRNFNDLFGESVDVNGSYVVVGAWQADSQGTSQMLDAGALYVYRREHQVSTDLPLSLSRVQLAGNPSRNGLLILIGLDHVQMPSRVRVTALTGQEIKSLQVPAPGVSTWQTDLSELPPGNYLISLEGEKGNTHWWKWTKL